MENNSKSNSIACIKKIGHIDEFTYRNSIYCMLLSNVGGEVRLSDYENSEKKFRVLKLDDAKLKKQKENILLKYNHCIAKKEWIERYDLTKGSIIYVKDQLLYNKNNKEYKYQGECQLVLIDENSRKCYTKVFFDKFLEINKLKDKDIELYNREISLLMDVDFGTVIKYKNVNEIKEAIVLDSICDKLVIVDRQDFRDILHNVKKYDDVQTRIIDKSDFLEIVANLVEERFILLDDIYDNCKPDYRVD